METSYIKLEMPKTSNDKEENPAWSMVFQSMRLWPLVGPSMTIERPQGLLLWCKYLMMSFLQLFLVLIILHIYLLFLLFPPSLIKLVFSGFARPSRSPLDNRELDVTEVKAVREFKRNVCYGHVLKVEMKII